MTKWYFSHILEPCTPIHTNSPYMCTQRKVLASQSFTDCCSSTILYYAIYWGIWEQKCSGGGRIQGCLLLGSLLPKSWKSLYLVDIVCVFCVIPRPSFFTLFNLAVTYLYHFIVVLSEVPTVALVTRRQSIRYFFSFHFISSMVCF